MRKAINKIIILTLMGTAGMLTAQNTDEALVTKDTTNSSNRIKLDGIAAVIGDYVILESDIEKTLIDLKKSGSLYPRYYPM